MKFSGVNSKWFGPLCGLFLLAGCGAMQPEPVSYDGLELVSTKPLDAVYKKPGADMGVYQQFKVADCTVAFTKGWQRDQNSANRGASRVSDKEVASIKARLSEMCTKTFKEALTADGGYTLSDQPGEAVLELRPAIVDLYINAPDVMSAGRSTSYTTSEGSMSLHLEAYDSVTGEIIGRVIDRRTARDTGQLRWTNSVTNAVEAQRILNRWGAILREMADGVHRMP